MVYICVLLNSAYQISKRSVEKLSNDELSHHARLNIFFFQFVKRKNVGLAGLRISLQSVGCQWLLLCVGLWIKTFGQFSLYKCFVTEKKRLELFSWRTLFACNNTPEISWNTTKQHLFFLIYQNFLGWLHVKRVFLVKKVLGLNITIFESVTRGVD